MPKEDICYDLADAIGPRLGVILVLNCVARFILKEEQNTISHINNVENCLHFSV